PQRLSDVLDSGVQSGMAAPLLLNGRPIGVVVLGYRSPRCFQPEDGEDLAFFTQQFAPIAGALQVRTQLRLRQAEAEALADLAQQGVRERDIGKLLTLLAEYTTCLPTADYSIATVVDEGNRISLRGTYGVRWAR